MKGFNIDEQIAGAPARHQEALKSEKQTYERIVETTKAVLSEVGIETRNQRVIDILEATGLAGYDSSSFRIHLLPELIDQVIDIAPKTYSGDEGMNTLGIGGIPPFLYREDDEFPLPASYAELSRVIDSVQENLDVVRFVSQPVKVHKGDALECNKIMDRLEDCIKITCSAYMDKNDAVKWFAGRDDWHDSICGLKSPLSCMDNMMDSLIRSAEDGNNLRLTTMPLAGRTAPQSPEGCMIINQCEVFFMLAVAQTVNPGMVCMFGGMPCPTKPNGDLAYSEDSMDMLNAAVSRINIWITGLPTVQSGGSTEEKVPGEKALADGMRGKRILTEFGVHNARHCFGVLDNLNFFSEEAFVQDCESYRRYRKEKGDTFVLKPLYTPEDQQAFEVITNVASGDYHVDYHTTANISAFEEWAKSAKEKGVLPE
ncbi:MAG: trimethylamine methyltransferase family protein [Deltaproteobacteria bacterium]|nr:trimethylamine methyltransferase family protein [Deltaproteobacteria bacterium]